MKKVKLVLGAVLAVAGPVAIVATALMPTAAVAQQKVSANVGKPLKAAQDAIVYIAGSQVTSATNTIEGAIDGVTLTVKKPTTQESGPVGLSVSYDPAAVTTKIKGFVSAYNSLMTQIGKLRSYDATTKTAGPMIGDSLLTSIESELRRTLTSVVPDQAQGFDTLAAIGITTQLDGTLGIDDTKLQKALTGNFEAVSRLFGSEQGIAKRLHTVADDRLKTGGALDVRSDTLSDQQRAIEKRKDDLEVRMAAVQRSYLQQFTRLDTLPTLPGGVFHTTLDQQGSEGERIRFDGRSEGLTIGDQAGDGLQGIALGVADEADRSTLDPPGGVHTVDGLLVQVQDPALGVGDDPALLVEGQVGQG